MVKFYIVIFFLCVWVEVSSQIKGDYIWEIGSGSNPNQNPIALSMEMNFNNGQLIVDTFYRSMDMDQFNTSFTSDSGELLIYSNGCQVRDGNHIYVSGTNFLSPGDVADNWCLQHIGYPDPEGGIILPFSNDSILIILHQRVVYQSNPTKAYIDSLFYSRLRKKDLSYILIKKTIPITGNYLSTGNIEAVKSIKANHWWVIQGVRETNAYTTIDLDSSGVDTLFTQEIGDSNVGTTLGQSVFSPDGSIYARFTTRDGLYLFDFNRETGILSTYRKIQLIDSSGYGGIAFSPNGQFIYVCSRENIYQFDSQEADIENSKVLIGQYDGYANPFPATFFHMQLGPDCRIYIGSTNGVDVMHVINNPDEKGLACNFEQHAFHFPVSNSITMPNFPNYRLDIAPPCDPNIVSGFWEYHVEYAPVNAYPNPTSGSVIIELGDQWDHSGSVDIYLTDQLGRQRKEDHFPLSEKNYILSLESLPPGIYFLSVQSGKKWFTSKVVRL